MMLTSLALMSSTHPPYTLKLFVGREAYQCDKLQAQCSAQALIVGTPSSFGALIEPPCHDPAPPL